MKVDTMRFVDRHIGVPLCFFATIISKIFFRRKKGVTPKNILFIELSEMGSAILVDPAMREAKKRYNAELFFLIFKNNKPSLELLQTVPDENIFVINPDGIINLVKDTFKFLFWARKNKIDTTIDLELFSRYTALLTGFSGADNTIGYYRFHNEGLYRGNMLTRKVSYNPHQHISKNFMALINAISERADDTPHSKTKVHDSDIVLAQAVINDTDRDFVKNIINELSPDWRNKYPRIVLINANASDLLTQRRWDRAHFIKLIDMILAKYPDTMVLLTGSKSEAGQADEIKAVFKNNNDHFNRVINFAGKLTLKQMLTLYDISALMVTNDSGPGHFSATTKLHTIVIFGPETPALYGSLGNSTPIYLGLSCSPCVSAANHRKTSCINNLCVKNITPEQVSKVVYKILDNNDK